MNKEKKQDKAIEDIKIEGMPEGIELYTEKQFRSDLSQLFLHSHFLSIIGTRCTRQLSFLPPTAGMFYSKKTKDYCLMANPWFMSFVSHENENARLHRMGILAHELYHLVFLHCSVRGQTVEPMLWNYAADLAVNSMIEATHGEDWVAPLMLLPGRGDFADFPKLKSAEFYLNMILQDEDLVEKIKQQAQGQCNGDCENCPAAPWNGGKPSKDGSGIPCPRQFDDHNAWTKDAATGEELGEAEKEAAIKAKDLVKSSYKEASSRNQWGNTPAEMVEYIKNLLKPKLNWKDIVKRFRSYAASSEWRTTIKKRNRRYGLDHPGSRRKRSARILVAMDQSGSVSAELVKKFFSEITGVAKEAQISTVNFDHGVDDSSFKKYKKGQKISPSRTRCGGTDFTSVIQWANKRLKMFDALIILTDLEAPYPTVASRLPRLWIADEGMIPWGDDPKWKKEQIIHIPQGAEVDRN